MGVRYDSHDKKLDQQRALIRDYDKAIDLIGEKMGKVWHPTKCWQPHPVLMTLVDKRKAEAAKLQRWLDKDF